MKSHSARSVSEFDGDAPSPQREDDTPAFAPSPVRAGTALRKGADASDNTVTVTAAPVSAATVPAEEAETGAKKKVGAAGGRKRPLVARRRKAEAQDAEGLSE